MARQKPAADEPAPSSLAPMAPPKGKTVLAAARPRGDPVVAERYFHYAGENVVWFMPCDGRVWIKFPTDDRTVKQLIQDAFATRAFRVTLFVVRAEDGPLATAVSIATP